MKKALCFILIVIIAALSGTAFAGSEERYVREEAARRNMKLISQEEAVRIARERIGSQNVRVKDADLEDEDDYWNGSDFRPVWSLELRARRDEYDVDVDAVTGQILKFKIDD